jgi:hypothetical protein
MCSCAIRTHAGSRNVASTCSRLPILCGAPLPMVEPGLLPLLISTAVTEWGFITITWLRSLSLTRARNDSQDLDISEAGRPKVAHDSVAGWRTGLHKVHGCAIQVCSYATLLNGLPGNQTILLRPSASERLPFSVSGLKCALSKARSRPKAAASPLTNMAPPIASPGAEAGETFQDIARSYNVSHPTIMRLFPSARSYNVSHPTIMRLFPSPFDPSAAVA